MMFYCDKMPKHSYSCLCPADVPCRMTDELNDMARLLPEAFTPDDGFASETLLLTTPPPAGMSIHKVAVRRVAGCLPLLAWTAKLERLASLCTMGRGLATRGPSGLWAYRLRHSGHGALLNPFSVSGAAFLTHACGVHDQRLDTGCVGQALHMACCEQPQRRCTGSWCLRALQCGVVWS